MNQRYFYEREEQVEHFKVMAAANPLGGSSQKDTQLKHRGAGPGELTMRKKILLSFLFPTNATAVIAADFAIFERAEQKKITWDGGQWVHSIVVIKKKHTDNLLSNSISIMTPLLQQLVEMAFSH